MDFKELAEYAKSLDRSRFIENENAVYSYIDEPLPIGYGQTISQPSLVLEMTYILSPDKNSSVLELGTGSGYQTALLANFSKIVYTIERIPELSQTAKERLDSLGFSNIIYMTGDGSKGWPEYAPFDRIIVTAAAEKLPHELIEQLKIGGKMIIPIGPQSVQDLYLITKNDKNEINSELIEKVRFVELKGKYGWSQKIPRN